MNFNREFNYYLETLGLLSYCNNFSTTKIELIEELNGLGFVGEKVYDAHLLDWEKLITTFDKMKVTNGDYNFYFKNVINEEKNFYTFLVALVAEYFELFDSEEKSDEYFRKIFIELICAIAEKSSINKQLSSLEFYEFLSVSDFNESEKWKFFSFYQSPKKLINKLFILINSNLSVCKKLYLEIDIETLISKCSILLESTREKNMISKQGEGLPIYPTLINPLSQIVLKTKRYFGLLNLDIFSDNDFSKEIDDNILIKLKALSDKSKFQILISLKSKPMYSLELANKLGLSAGTISHHMAVLLQINLVNIDKKSGRVYYHLNSDEIEKTIKGLENLLI